MTTAFGCAGNIPEAHVARAAGEWNVHLPTSASPIDELAYGRGGNGSAARVSAPEPAGQLAAVSSHPARAVRAHRKTHAVKSDDMTTVAMTPEAQQPAAAAAPASEPMQLAQTEPSAEQRYGQRETASRELEKFKAGDAIVIGAGTLVVVLLIVLLVVLLIR